MAFVALGSNLGDPVRTVREAISRLAALSGEPLAVSSLWETAPVDCPPGSPSFVNAVVGLTPHPSETPESLLEKLQDLEREFGRRPKQILNESRPLDLDLIAFGQETRLVAPKFPGEIGNAPQLVLPHPRAHERRFVLQPWSEIAPDFILAGQTRTVAQLLAHLPPGEDIRKF